jgi:hypothetical protein
VEVGDVGLRMSARFSPASGYVVEIYGLSDPLSMWIAVEPHMAGIIVLTGKRRDRYPARI